MTLTLIVGEEPERFSVLKSTLKEKGFKVVDATSVKVAENILNELSVDLLIVDETIKGVEGLEFLKSTIMTNAFLNTALVSSMNHEYFHDETEGLGIIMQLSKSPTYEESSTLVEKVNEILSITGKIGVLK